MLYNCIKHPPTMDNSFVIIDGYVDNLNDMDNLNNDMFRTTAELYENPMFKTQYLVPSAIAIQQNKTDTNTDILRNTINYQILSTEIIIILINMLYFGGLSIGLLFQTDILFGVLIYIFGFLLQTKYLDSSYDMFITMERMRALDRYIIIFLEVIVAMFINTKYVMIPLNVIQAPQIMNIILNLQFVKVRIEKIYDYLQKISDIIVNNLVAKTLSIIFAKCLKNSDNLANNLADIGNITDMTKSISIKVVNTKIEPKDIAPFMTKFNYKLSIHFLSTFLVASGLQYFEQDGATFYTVLFRNYYFRQLYLNDINTNKRILNDILDTRDYSKIIDPYFLNVIIQLYAESGKNDNTSIVEKINEILGIFLDGFFQIMTLWSICSISGSVLMGNLCNTIFIWDNKKKIIMNAICSVILYFVFYSDHLLSLILLKISLFILNTKITYDIIKKIYKDLSQPKIKQN